MRDALYCFFSPNCMLSEYFSFPFDFAHAKQTEGTQSSPTKIRKIQPRSNGRPRKMIIPKSEKKILIKRTELTSYLYVVYSVVESLWLSSARHNQ